MEANRKLSRKLKLIYGFGFSAEGIKNNSFLVLLFFFYQQIVGLDATLCGLAMMIALIVDAIVDPLIGVWSDGTRSRLGRRHPFLYASSLPFGICFFAVFSPPRGLSEVDLFFWLLCTAIGTRCAMSLFDIPHQSLGAELTSDYEERAMLQTLRTVFPWLFGLINAYLIYHFFLPDTQVYPQGLLNPAGYPKVAIWGGTAVILMTFISGLGTQRAALAAQPHVSRLPATSIQDLREGIISAFRNPSFRNVIAAGLLLQVGFGMSEMLNPYLATAFWQITSSQMEVFLVVIFVATLVVPPITGRLMARFDKRKVAVLCCAVMVSIRGLSILARWLGILPAGSDPLLMRVLAFTAFFEFTAIIISMAMVGAMIADITDEHEVRTGRRQEGVLFAANAFLIQACTGLGSFMGGNVVKLSGLQPGAAGAATAGEAGRNLGLFAMVFVVSFWVGSAYFFSRYQLSRERHAEIMTQLGRTGQTIADPAEATA